MHLTVHCTKRWFERGKINTSRQCGQFVQHAACQSQLFDDVVHSHQLLAFVHQFVQFVRQLRVSEKLCTVDADLSLIKTYNESGTM